MKKQAIWAVVGLVALGWTGTAQAGGYDTPMLYTARHQGMGGTAIAYVDDGAAFYHNPAGIGAYDTANILLGVGVLLGGITANPVPGSTEAIDSNTTVAPLPLLGGGVRLFNTNAGGANNFAMVLGAGVFPVASAGGSYTYDTAGGGTIDDGTTLIFIEAAPGIGLALENTPVGDFRLGATYRITYVSLSRSIAAQGAAEPSTDVAPSGVNTAGFRVGMQWQPIPEVQFGVTYRHRIDTDISQDGGRALNMDLTRNETTFTLPGRIGFGLRGDYMNVGLALDLEYAFNGQNTSAPLVGYNAILPDGIEVPNVFNWGDALTVRVGGEYTIDLGDERAIKPRVGFVFDDTTSNRNWPTAFGTPAAPTFILSAGAGYDAGPWELNLAYAYRWGSTTITQEDVDTGQDLQACAFCGGPGDYFIGLHGIYLDFSWDFE